jgi:hypothetical protein
LPATALRNYHAGRCADTAGTIVKSCREFVFGRILFNNCQALQARRSKVLQPAAGLGKFSPTEDIFDFDRLRDENLDNRIRSA